MSDNEVPDDLARSQRGVRLETLLRDLVPDFNEPRDLLIDLDDLAGSLAFMRLLVRTGEYAEFSKVRLRRSMCSVRVNGREYEAPHVHLKSGALAEVRIFLGRTPDDVRPDDAFGRVYKLGPDQEAILNFVKAHHSELLGYWQEMGNPLHSPPAIAVKTQLGKDHPAMGRLSRSVKKQKTNRTTN